MDFLKDRRTVLALAGAAVALLAGLAIAWALVRAQHRGRDGSPPPPASKAGLVIDSARPVRDGRMDAAKPLRCFLAGQFVGEMTPGRLRQDATASPTDALDVGLDPVRRPWPPGPGRRGDHPLPPPPARPGRLNRLPREPAPAAPPQIQVVGAPRRRLLALRRRPVAQAARRDQPLAACVQTLFAGRCERAGEAAYGRWGQQTLRLGPGRVEISADNRSFRPLIDQAGCPTTG